MAEEQKEELDITASKFDFTGFFIVFDGDHVRSDVMPVDKLMSTLRLYFPYLEPEPAVELPQANHRDYVLRRGFPDAIRFVLKQQLFREAEGLERFKRIVKFLMDVIDFVLLWIPHDHAGMLGCLASIFDVQKNLFRASSAQAMLDEYVKSVDKVVSEKTKEWCDPKKIGNRVAWDHVNSRLVGVFMNYFGGKGGFDLMLQRMAGKPLPLDALKTMVKVFQRLRSLAGEALIMGVYPQLPKLVFDRQLLDLDTNDLRRVTKKDIEELDRSMRMVLRANVTGEKHEDVCDRFCLAFALKCLKSPLQDKKFNGLAHIEESIESIGRDRKMIFRPPVTVSQIPDIERKVSSLLSWLRENEILELVFQRDNMRRELIVLTKKTVRFLQQEGELDLKHVAILLDGILDHHHDKNRDVRDALYDTIIESADRITNPEMAQLIWNTIRRMEPAKHYCSRTIKLLKSIIDGSRDEAFALEVTSLIWRMSQDSSRAPMDCISAALEMVPRIAEELGLDLIPDSIKNLRKKRNGLQSLKLLSDLVGKTPKARRVEVAEAIVVDQEVFALAVEELAHYKRLAMTARAEMGSKPRDWDNEVLVGLFPHLEAVDTRLALLNRLTDEARRLPDQEYLPELWKTAVETHLTEKECDMGLEWLSNMCLYEPVLADSLFEKVYLKHGVATKIFTQTERSFNAFLGLFYAVNHDAGNLRLKTRDGNVLSFEDCLCWPYIGIRELMYCLVHNASAELFTRGQDIIINLHLTLSPSHIHNTDSFREGLAEMLFDMLEDGMKKEEAKTNAAVDGDDDDVVVVVDDANDDADDAGWMDRVIGLLRSMVVLTKPKEEIEEKKDGGKESGAASGAGAEELDAEEEASKPPLFSISSSDKDKVLSFMEMMGEGFPEEYRYSICAILVKESNWNIERAVNDYLMDMEGKTIRTLEEAKKFKRCSPFDDNENNAGVDEAAPKAPAVEGLSMAKVISSSARYYDILFALLNRSDVDREAIWTLLKMLPPDARLTRLLSDELAGGVINWGNVLGDKASYQLLYSLELVRQSIPSDEDSPEKYESSTEWCRVFVQRGGFAFLFVILNQIARMEHRGHIERACLGHLLRIVFYFMRSELENTLAESLDGNRKLEHELRFSMTSATTLKEAAPFESLGTLMFYLLTEQSKGKDKTKKKNKKSKKKKRPDESGFDDADIPRFAAYLLAGSILKEPRILDTLAEDAEFGDRLKRLLCCSDAALRQHVSNQLLYLCREFKKEEGSSSKHNAVPFFLSHLLSFLSFIPSLLTDDSMGLQSMHVFELICELVRSRPQFLGEALASLDWVKGDDEHRPIDVLLIAVCDKIRNRGDGREVMGAEDQALAGLFQLGSVLMDSHSSNEEEAKTAEIVATLSMVEVMISEFLFKQGSAQRCVALRTRELGLQFAGRLCRANTAAWEYTVQFLGEHHLKQEPLSSWRPVESVSSKRTRYVGLRNLGATCYMNATIQQLFMMPELRNTVLASAVDTKERDGDHKMLWQFQKVMATLLHSDTSWADTEPFVRTLRDGMGDPINTSRQEDAYDFLTRFQEQLEGQMSQGQKGDEKVFRKMFSVGMSQEIECRNGHARATAQEPEPVLQVDFGPTIEQALDTTFGLGGDPISDYKCDDCGKKVDIVKRHMIHTTSDQLVVMLRRFEWDYFATGGNTRKKLQGRFEIPHTLNLSPYTESGIKQRRLDKQPVMSADWEYELRGIVVHSGKTMDSGHYYSIIRDLDTGNWFKFDDREVTPFPFEYLDESHPKFIGECYMLLFQKVNDDLTKSQHLLDSQSISKVDTGILKEVEAVNATVLGQRRFLEMPYFSFLLDLLSVRPISSEDSLYNRAWVRLPPPPSDKGKEEEVSEAERLSVMAPIVASEGGASALLAAQMGCLFVWETWTRSRQQVGEHRQEILGLWADDILPHLFTDNVPACSWAVRELLVRRQRWVRFFLLECEEPWIRTAFMKWLVVVVKTVAAAEVAQEQPEEPSLFRIRAMESMQEQQKEPIGLAGRFVDLVFSYMELSRGHWRRFHEYFSFIREICVASNPVRLHIACGLYQSYSPKPMRALTLYVDYFMGEFSPFYRELPYEKQLDRATLGNKMGGESADLRSHFWSMYEMSRALDTGTGKAVEERPGGPGYRQVAPSETDLKMWFRVEMMMPLIKQSYNSEANAQMVAYWCWEHKEHSNWFLKVVMDCYFKEQSSGVFDVVMALLTLNDSLSPIRVASLIGDRASGILSAMRERRNYQGSNTVEQLGKLAAVLPVNPVLVSYLRFSNESWKTWLPEFLWTNINPKVPKETQQAFEVLMVDGGFESADVDWNAVLQIEGQAAVNGDDVTESDTAVDDGDDEEDHGEEDEENILGTTHMEVD